MNDMIIDYLREAAVYSMAFAPQHTQDTLYWKAKEEIEMLRQALMAVQNFPAHPGGRPEDKSSESVDAPSWREGWISAVHAVQEAALPEQYRSRR